jgi:hypothetical protein
MLRPGQQSFQESIADLGDEVPHGHASLDAR